MDETSIYTFWQKEGFFKADPNSNKKTYSLLMPPPNLTGELHLGHAMEHSIMDAIARFKRMQGYDVLLLPGVDHAGIQFEGTLDKILAKEGLSKQKLGREEWLIRAWSCKYTIYNSIHKTWTLMGISADWSREVFTMDPKVTKAMFTEFNTFWEQGLLYKGAYIVQWCPKDQTAIEDLEMEYQERTEKLYYVKYEIKEKPGEYITLATTRPETIFADLAIAIYPDHPKYSKYINMTAISPFEKYPPVSEIYNSQIIKPIKVIQDPRVDKKFGTGALKITPGHDILDYQIGKDHDLGIVNIIDKKGRMFPFVGELSNLPVIEARAKAVEILQKIGALEKVEDYTHGVPVCERCKTTVEPLISEEWFVKMKPLAEKALVNLDQINFLPKNYHKILGDWLKEIHDWSISRSLWWGHRIPVWYCGKCNPNHLVGKDKDMVISTDEPDKTCQTCSEKHWVQDEQVLDTWFSSGLWPMATLGWPDETSELKKYFPWDFETSAPEIKYLWIARMIMLSLWFKDEIPFKNQFFHGMLRDLQGRKFSKSLGNGISPYDLVNQWGVDATRMALYGYSIPGRDAKTSRQLMDERCKNFRNFGTKLRNIHRFIYELKTQVSIAVGGKEREGFGTDESAAEFNTGQLTHPEDKEIIEELNQLISDVTKNLESFQLHLATESLYEFIWHKFADIYIEKSKSRRSEAQPVLEYVFITTIKLLHPFMPFLTEELYQKLALSKVEGLPKQEKSVMLATWPKIKD